MNPADDGRDSAPLPPPPPRPRELPPARTRPPPLEAALLRHRRPRALHPQHHLSHFPPHFSRFLSPRDAQVPFDTVSHRNLCSSFIFSILLVFCPFSLLKREEGSLREFFAMASRESCRHWDGIHRVGRLLRRAGEEAESLHVEDRKPQVNLGSIRSTDYLNNVMKKITLPDRNNI